MSNESDLNAAAKAMYEAETAGKKMPWQLAQYFPAWEHLSESVQRIWIEKAQRKQ